MPPISSKSNSCMDRKSIQGEIKIPAKKVAKTRVTKEARETIAGEEVGD